MAYMDLYYHLKALKRMGFTHNPDDYHPEVLESLVFIECQLSKFDADDMKRQAEQQRNHRAPTPRIPTRPIRK